MTSNRYTSEFNNHILTLMSEEIKENIELVRELQSKIFDDKFKELSYETQIEMQIAVDERNEHITNTIKMYEMYIEKAFNKIT